MTYSCARHAALIFCLLLGAPAAYGADTPGALPPAHTVRSVWNIGIQSCNAGGGNSYTRRPDQSASIESRTVRVPEIGYEFSIPELPGVEETSVSVHLNDQSRGIVDHYFLISAGDWQEPVAAIVVTKLPPSMRGTTNVFATVRDVETGSAAAAGIVAKLTEMSGPYGPALEMLVPNRLGSYC